MTDFNTNPPPENSPELGDEETPAPEITLKEAVVLDTPEVLGDGLVANQFSIDYIYLSEKSLQIYLSPTILGSVKLGLGDEPSDLTLSDEDKVHGLTFLSALKAAIKTKIEA